MTLRELYFAGRRGCGPEYEDCIDVDWKAETEQAEEEQEWHCQG